MPSSKTSLSIPNAVNPSAITWILSDSLTRSSFAPVRTVSPFAQLAAINKTGNSSIASGTRFSGISMPFSSDEVTLISAMSSPA